MRSAHLLPERSEGKTKMMKQQYLPFTVLKLEEFRASADESRNRCNSTYRLRYTPKGARQQRSRATMRHAHLLPERREGKTKAISNSTYRFRYAPKGARQQRSRATMKSAHLKYLSEARVKQR